jgi:hypothetical protein
MKKKTKELNYHKSRRRQKAKMPAIRKIQKHKLMKTSKENMDSTCFLKDLLSS